MKTRTKILIVVVSALMMAFLRQDWDNLVSSFWEGYQQARQR